ncbi:MAG: SoxR reducing system RseC family protein [Duncaniella sp.]|nr:SoxR reducing system RseC family protein [Duncaniella sp.]
MKKDNVTHRGIITRIDPSSHSLTIHTEEDCKCEGCAVVAICSKSSDPAAEKGTVGEDVVIDVPDAAEFRVGQRVEVSAGSASTLRATLWALILPTVIFVSVLLGVNLGCPAAGGWAILLAFIALGIYDLGLWLFRRKLASKIAWQVTRLS